MLNLSHFICLGFLVFFLFGCKAPQDPLNGGSSSGGSVFGANAESNDEDSYSRIIELDGDLTVYEGDVAEFRNTIVYLRGNITVKNGAKLILKSSKIVVEQSRNNQYKLEVFGRGELSMTDTNLTSSDKWYNWYFYDEASVKLINVEWHGWHTIYDRASLYVERARVGLTFDRDSQASVLVKNARDVAINLHLPDGTYDMSLPSGWHSDWSMNDLGVRLPYHVQISNSTIDRFQLDLSDKVHVTLRDTKKTSVWWNLGSWNHKNGRTKLRGLKPQHYDDQNFVAETSSLRIVNSSVQSWSISTHSDVRLIVSDSTLSELYMYGSSFVTLYGTWIQNDLEMRDSSVIDLRESSKIPR